MREAETNTVLRNYSPRRCFRPTLVEKSRARAHRRNRILMVQTSEHRFHEYERTRRQSMSVF